MAEAKSETLRFQSAALLEADNDTDKNAVHFRGTGPSPLGGPVPPFRYRPVSASMGERTNPITEFQAAELAGAVSEISDTPVARESQARDASRNAMRGRAGCPEPDNPCGHAGPSL